MSLKIQPSLENPTCLVCAMTLAGWTHRARGGAQAETRRHRAAYRIQLESGHTDHDTGGGRLGYITWSQVVIFFATNYVVSLLGRQYIDPRRIPVRYYVEISAHFFDAKVEDVLTKSDNLNIYITVHKESKSI
jgi:hypothetical protein